MGWTFTFEKVPAAIQGIALGNAGLASLFVLLGKIYNRSDDYVVAVYVHAPISIFFLSLYVGKVIFHPKAFLTDAAAPITNFTYGATAICLSLLASFLALPQFDLPYEYGLAGVSAAAIFQLLQEVWFLHTCYKSNTGPQPFWNAACVSISITTITGVSVNMPGWIRQLAWFVGLATMAITMPAQLWSVFKHHRIFGGTGDSADIPKLNNNPSVAIMQATASILCSGWHATSFETSSDRMKDAVGTIFFVASMLWFALTVLALAVRWKVVLGAITSQNPALSAMTFPFVITATAAAFYFKREGGETLEIVVWALFGLCSTLVMSVTLLYFKLLLFGQMLWKPSMGKAHDSFASDMLEKATFGVEESKPGNVDVVSKLASSEFCDTGVRAFDVPL